MKTIKVSEATELQLDWLVAKAEGELRPIGNVLLQDGCLYLIEPGDYEHQDAWRKYSPTTNWAQGGTLIEREGISIYRMTSDWSAAYNPSGATQDGPTPLTAAMRCFCCSKVGDTVEVPDELI